MTISEISVHIMGCQVKICIAISLQMSNFHGIVIWFFLPRKRALIGNVWYMVLFPAHSQPGSEDSDSEEDMDYKPMEEDWKKVLLLMY